MSLRYRRATKSVTLKLAEVFGVIKTLAAMVRWTRCPAHAVVADQVAA